MNKITKNRKYFQDRFSALKSERESWKNTWIDLRDYILPEAARFFGKTDTNKGDRKQDVLDGTAIRANHILAVGLQSGLTSPSRSWFRLSLENEAIAEQYQVKVWLDDCEKAMRSVFQRSNLYDVLYNTYAELGAFGTFAFIILEDEKYVLRFVPCTIGEFCIGLNSANRVNAFYRDFTMTAAQMVEAFGIEACSTAVKEAYARNSRDTWFEVVHAIEENIDRDDTKVDNNNFPFVSVYYESGNEEKEFLKKEGFLEFPVIAPRWQVYGKNIYGTSPARDCLGHIKMLQEMQKKTLEAVEKQINPPMVASSEVYGENILPGGVTYVDFSQQGQFAPAYQITPDWTGMQNKILDIRQDVKQMFYNDLFFMIASAGKSMTATEVMERQEEKLTMLSPVVERLQTELLNPLIERTFNIMMRNGLIPMPPEEIQGETIKVKYISLLAQAQEYLRDVNGIRDLMGFAGNVVSVFPEIVDKFNTDEVIKQYAGAIGVDPNILRSDEEVAQIRQARAEAQANAQRAESFNQSAMAARTLSQAKLDKTNVLQELIG